MAEGLINYHLEGTWQAQSAGTQPAGYVHPLAIEAMGESGIDIGDAESKSVEAFRDVPFDAVITVCDDAAENCPLWLGDGQVVHIGFPDPAVATGSKEERLVTFRQVRDNIRERVVGYLADWSNG
jgi:arsenate reductase